MIFNNYTIIYTLGNLFMAYVIYKFIHIFYSTCKVNEILETITYIGYFILITTTHVFFRIPIVVMSMNVLLLFLLTLLYEGSIKKSVLSVSFIYFSLMSIETLFVFLTSVLYLNLLVPFKYESEFGIIVIRIASFALVFLVQGFKNVKNEYALPNIYWLSLLAIPAGTIIMLFAVFMNASLPRSIMFLCMFSALTINIFTFFLYDKISALLVSQMNKRIIEEQNRYYEYQVQMMKTTLDHMRVLRHDLKNKLSPLYALAVAGRCEELATQLAELTSICCIGNEYSNSGNSTVDSIINFKLQQAEVENIVITTDILVPKELCIPTFDIAVILGNLIDNALESALKTESRWINIKVKYTKGRLITEISNSYDGIVKKTANHFYSRKENSADHGLGLKSVQTVLQKYNGAIQITHDEKRFKTKSLMYLR